METTVDTIGQSPLPVSQPADLSEVKEALHDQYRASVEGHGAYWHIRKAWADLVFSHEDLFLGAAIPPAAHREGDPYFVYVSEKEDLEHVRAHYAKVKQELIAKIEAGTEKKYRAYKVEDLLKIEVRRIPRGADGKLAFPWYEHGVLHIPRRAIAPGTKRYKGTQFNWDSAFMIFGLAQDDEMDLCFDMLENLLYQVEHYDGPLNANLSFYMLDGKSRSQLPLLAACVLIVHNKWDELKDRRRSGDDRIAWVKSVLPLLEKHYRHWMTAPNYHEETGLSRFNTTSTLPGPDTMFWEPGHYKHAYEALHEMWLREKDEVRPMAERPYQARKNAYYVTQLLEFDAETGEPVPFEINMETNTVRGLSGQYFRADLAMRESGFDPSRRFGFLNADIVNHVPVCLNSFLYKMAKEIAVLYGFVGEPEKEAEWDATARAVEHGIQSYLWDDAAPQFAGDEPQEVANPMYPSFRDRNISPLAEEFQIGVFRRYNFAANVFAPMWARVATPEQAAMIVAKSYPLLKTPYGLKTSTTRSGCQWDDPLIWAPLQVIAVEGLEHYGYYAEAMELAQSYVGAIEAEFERSGALYEKIEGVTGTSDTGKYIGDGVGYAENDQGFGWTNTAYIMLKIAIVRLGLALG